jgi:hypothetical protein
MPDDFTDRAQVALNLYVNVFDNTETCEEVGEHLAYLMGAVLKGGNASVAFQNSVPSEVAFVRLLRECFPPEAPVWNYVTIEESVV